MSGSLSLAWRNIWRNKRRTLISMSASGVGLLLVIFYSGLMGGMMGEAKNQLDNGGLGHVEVVADGFRPKHDVEKVMPGDVEWRKSLQLPPGAEAGTRVLARGLATSARGNDPVQVFGVEWSQEPLLSAHLKTLKDGELPADAKGIVVGDKLAERLGLKLGSKLRLMVSRADGEMGADLFRVRGIFHSISPTIGQRQVYVSQDAARALLGIEHGSHQLVVQLSEPNDADAVSASLKKQLGAGYDVQTWGELLPILKRMDALTNNVVIAMAIFVYLLVGLGVLNTMLMSVLERTREFGVLMSLGTRPSRIVRVVLAESFWIGTLSVLIGGAVGGLLSWYFSTHGISLGGGESLEMEGVTLSRMLRTRFSWADIAKAGSFVYLMALIVGLYPASRITRLQPAEALRRT